MHAATGHSFPLCFRRSAWKQPSGTMQLIVLGPRLSIVFVAIEALLCQLPELRCIHGAGSSEEEGEECVRLHTGKRLA
jgi:hypothetical protein